MYGREQCPQEMWIAKDEGEGMGVQEEGWLICTDGL